MNIKAAVRRKRQQSGRQYFSVSDDDDDIRVKRTKLCEYPFVTERLRL